MSKQRVKGERIGVSACGGGRDALPRDPALHVWDAFPNALRWQSRAFGYRGPFYYLHLIHLRALIGRATPDAPERNHRLRRCTGRHHRRCLRRIARERVPTSHTPTRPYADTPIRLPLPVDSDQGIQKILGADNPGGISFRVHDGREAVERRAESPEHDRCLLIRSNGQNATNIMSDGGVRGPVNEEIKDIDQPDDLARCVSHWITVKSGASRELDELFDGCLPDGRSQLSKD